MRFVMFGFRTLWGKWVVFQTLIDRVNNWWYLSMWFCKPTVFRVIGRPNHAYVTQWFLLKLILLPYCYIYCYSVLDLLFHFLFHFTFYRSIYLYLLLWCERRSKAVVSLSIRCLAPRPIVHALISFPSVSRGMGYCFGTLD